MVASSYHDSVALIMFTLVNAYVTYNGPAKHSDRMLYKNGRHSQHGEVSNIAVSGTKTKY